MEIKLNGGSIAYLKTIFDTTVVQEETCELSVADNMPDILRIAQTTSVVTVKNKAADTGRVTVNGSVALRNVLPRRCGWPAENNSRPALYLYIQRRTDRSGDESVRFLPRYLRGRLIYHVEKVCCPGDPVHGADWL